MRVRKLSVGGAASTTRIFVYDVGAQGEGVTGSYPRLLGEYDGNGEVLREYLWLGDMPVALLSGPANTTKIYPIHADHLNTPRVVLDEQGRMRWVWDGEPFGASAPQENPQGLGTLEMPLRFSGQYADTETGLFVNHFRYYSPVLGRYTQSDPIGLAGGWNTYSYVGGNPLSRTDRLGLATDQEIRNAVATLRCANPGEFDKLARSITMADMGENGAGMTDWSNNITLNSNLYGDSKTPVMDMIRSEFLQTLAHEMLHVNQGIGGKAITRIRMGNPLGVLHRQLDAKAEAMITRQLLDQYNKALQNGDSGCSCTR